jgi:hypothetical protein
VEEKDGNIKGYEFKWNFKKSKIPSTFIQAYNAEGFIIDRTNFRELVKI